MGKIQLLNAGAKALELSTKGTHTYHLTDHRIPSLFLGRYGTTTPQWLQFRTTEDYLKAWERCPPIAAVLIRKAQADINGRVCFYKRDKPEEPIENPNYTPAAKKIKRLFEKPNPLQTWRKFRTQQKIYQQLFGFCPVLMVRPYGFNDPTDTVQMWNLPPQFVEIKTTGVYLKATKTSDIIEKIIFKYNGSQTELDVESVLILNDSTISLNNQIVSDSRIRALVEPISNVVAANTALNVLITKHGAVGILANRDKDGTGEKTAIPKSEKEYIQREFQKYGLSHEQAQVIITSANLEWQPMVQKVRELMLHETLHESTIEITDSYGYPYELLGNVRGVSYANKKDAKTAFYQDTVIPEAEADFESYNEYFKLTETNVELFYDFSHVEALQLSAGEQATANKANAEAYRNMYEGGAITRNRYRELLNQPTKPGDDVYVYETPEAKQAAENEAQRQNEQNEQNANNNQN